MPYPLNCPEARSRKQRNSGAKMSKITIEQMADRVSALIEERLKITGNSLETRLKRAGHRLPRRVLDAGEVLVSATEMAQIPKLLMQIDHEAVAEAYDLCIKHLKSVDLAARRRGLLLDIGARIAFVLLMVILLTVGVLYWRGFV